MSALYDDNMFTKIRSSIIAITPEALHTQPTYSKVRCARAGNDQPFRPKVFATQDAQIPSSDSLESVDISSPSSQETGPFSNLMGSFGDVVQDIRRRSAFVVSEPEVEPRVSFDSKESDAESKIPSIPEIPDFGQFQSWADSIGDVVQDIGRRSTILVSTPGLQPRVQGLPHAQEDIPDANAQSGRFQNWAEAIGDVAQDIRRRSTLLVPTPAVQPRVQGLAPAEEDTPEANAQVGSFQNWAGAIGDVVQDIGRRSTLLVPTAPEATYEPKAQESTETEETVSATNAKHVGWRTWAATMATDVAAMATDAATPQSAPEPVKEVSLEGPVDFYATAPAAVQDKINEFYDIKSDVRVGWRSWAYASVIGEASTDSNSVASDATQPRKSKRWSIMDYVPVPGEYVHASVSKIPGQPHVDDDCNSRRRSIDVLFTNTKAVVNISSKYLVVRDRADSDWFESRRTSVGPISDTVSRRSSVDTVIDIQ